MNPEERSEATFGLWDGTVSIVGFVFALLIHHSPTSSITIGGLGVAIGATVSMGTGAYESAIGPKPARIRNAATMGLATLIGTAIPVAPFFFLGRTPALLLGSAGCIAAAAWISWEKRAGVKGAVATYAMLLAAIGLTLGIVALIPSSA